MSARTKLNTAYITASVVVAGVIGWLTGSWAFLGISLAILLILHLCEGNIRSKK
jgi:hypothetical protein